VARRGGAVGINGGLGSGEAEEGRRAGSGLGSGADEDIDTESVPSRFWPGCGIRVGFGGPPSAAQGSPVHNMNWPVGISQNKTKNRTGLWADTTPTLHANAGFK